MKIYLTPSATRRYSIELPVGDPTSGPAYGKKTMPVVAVAMAATSFVSGAAAFTAAAAGSMAAIAAGATMVGSALTIVGTITGNSKLAKIGGILAIGGLAGSALSSAAGAGEAAGQVAQGATESAADTISGAVAEAGRAAGGADVFAGIGGTSELNILDAASGPGQAQLVSDAASGTQRVGLINMKPEDMGFLDSPEIAALEPSSQIPLGADASSSFKTMAPNAMSAGDTQVAQSLKGNPFDTADIIRAAREEAAGGRGLAGYFNEFGQWVERNKELSKLGMQGVTAFAGNLVPSSKDKALTSYYDAKTEEAKRRALWASGRTA